MVGRPSCRSGSGRETLPEVLKWSGDPPGGLEVVGRPFWRSGNVRKTHSVIEVVERSSRRCGAGWETLPEVRKWSETLPEVLKWLGDPP